MKNFQQVCKNFRKVFTKLSKNCMVNEKFVQEPRKKFAKDLVKYCTYKKCWGKKF